MQQQEFFDVLILGSGAAGLSTALQLAQTCPSAIRIAVVCKGTLGEGATRYAQGGISAVFDDDDSIESHVADTLVAGAGLCKRPVVEFVVSQARREIERLASFGMQFTKVEDPDNGTRLHLTQEGGHSHRRVVHAADATGLSITNTLESQVRRCPNIHVLEHHIAIDLITAGKLGITPDRCLGAYLMDIPRSRIVTLAARFTVLATGGAGKVYLYTSNPDVATGDGIAMAWRAGCVVANMEFVQFHPTCLYHPAAKSFLITEALRGEGGQLKLPNGERFMERFDPRLELAPRDIVARAIDHEMKRLGSDCVYLDISHKSPEFIEAHFPTISATCREFGIDITQQPIPVVPAAHYTCGGVVTNLAGRTTLQSLYALGEVACTGLHGANRMASNSLLECLVFANAVAKDIVATLDDVPMAQQLPAWDESRVTNSDEEIVVAHNWDELLRFMWDYVGIVRTTKRLQRARHRVDLLHSEIAEYYGNFRVTPDLIELRNLVQVAELIIRAALKRRESRGLHYTLDYPQTSEAGTAADTILRAGDFS
ncbi:MAG: L-aspartate oxidase [Gammaproteobacteria bacterium]|nr:L-aspartate oxidase [Gammaproteobacteria bacterium]